MLKFENFTKSIDNDIKLDGKNAFFMFLNLIDEMRMNFIKSSNYLNVGKYQLFLTTETIKNKIEFVNYFRDSLSLKTTCDTAQKIKDDRISHYFGLKNNILEYGFYDSIKNSVYKTGEFETNNKFINNLKSYKCISLVENILKNININDLLFLQEIKSALKYWYENKGDILILNNKVIRKSIHKDEIENNENLLKPYEKWCEKFKWINKVYYYIDDMDDNDKINYYIKLK